MKLHVAACDDDALFLQRLQATLTQAAQQLRLTVVLRKFSCGNALVQAVEENGAQFDVIFLDIDMPTGSGKAVAERLRRTDRSFLLVFISAMADEVYHIFEYDTAYFIPKAQFDERFEPMLRHLIGKLEAQQQDVIQCTVRDETGRKQAMRFSVRDILYLESVTREVHLHTLQASFQVISSGFEQLKQSLALLGFVETHRTCIVNARHLEAVDLDSVTLQNGSVLPLSRRKRQHVFAVMARVLEDSLQ